jgi:hypothetical protein
VLGRQGDRRADAAVGGHRVEPERREREVEVAVGRMEDERVWHAPVEASDHWFDALWVESCWRPW